MNLFFLIAFLFAFIKKISYFNLPVNLFSLTFLMYFLMYLLTHYTYLYLIIIDFYMISVYSLINIPERRRVLDCINCDLLVDFSIRPVSATAKE